MVMRSAREIVYDKFIKPFQGKSSGNIGTELEFPLINNNGEDVDIKFVRSIMDYFEGYGFSCVLYGTGGEKLFMENAAGDTLSFDNSYNNFEFSMMYGDNLCDIERRFSEYFEQVNQFLSLNNHSLCCMGTNPNYHSISVNHTPFSTYNMVSEYLHKYPKSHKYYDFPAFMSSVQTHLDVSLPDLPEAYTLFCKMDFVRALLFGNSPDFEGKGWRIFRDYLWAESGFGNCPNITGTVDIRFETVEDIENFILEKGIFNRIRNGKYETFFPIRLKEYFDNPIHGAQENDIECYLSFCNTEITSRGTLEIRSDCTQKRERLFMPPAFNLGILNNMGEAESVLDGFMTDNSILKKPSELRKYATECRDELIAPRDALVKLCNDMVCAARKGLEKRRKGEEKYLIM